MNPLLRCMQLPSPLSRVEFRPVATAAQASAANAAASSANPALDRHHHYRRRHQQYQYQLGRVRTAAWALTNLLAPPDTASSPQLASRRAHAAVRAGTLDVLCPMLLLLGGGVGTDGRSDRGGKSNRNGSSSSCDIGMDEEDEQGASFDEEHEDIFVEAAWLLSALLPRCATANASGAIASATSASAGIAADDGEACGIQSDGCTFAFGSNNHITDSANIAAGSETRSVLLHRLVASGAIEAVATRLLSVCSSLPIHAAAHLPGLFSNASGSAPAASAGVGNIGIFEMRGPAASANVPEPSTSIILPCVRLLTQALLAELEPDGPVSVAIGAGAVIDPASRSSPEVFSLGASQTLSSSHQLQQQQCGSVVSIALRGPALLQAMCACLQHSNRYANYAC